ncbi:MAG TPA: chromosomal replication initiator protein DnaA [Thermoleophilaceae bacterium]|nr:chromosomal replication initiator protein DnaA [Thermoleophilaceae bacterium]
MAAQLEMLWEDIRGELRREVPDFKFHIWLEPLEAVGLSGRTLYVRAPEHIRTSVAERYLPLLRRAAGLCAEEPLALEIVGEGWRPEHAEACGAEEPAPVTTGLNPKYSFEQFVIGEGNRFAHAAALAAAELPGQAYNPLFLHGPPGLGKTHLLHAIGTYVHRFGGGLRVRYATIEEFTSEFVGAVRERRTEGFKDSFRQADVVLIDDVQFLAGRTRTREEFFHTFNALIDSGRQLVLTSDRSPEDLPDLEDRLAERFRSGLVVELEPPALSVREAILAKRARLDGVDVGPDVLAEIAAGVTSSVRALEGALIRVVAYSSLRGQSPTPELVRHVLRRLGVDPGEGAFGIAQIVDAAAQEFGVERAALLARDRRAPVSAARHVAMYLARELTEHSLPEIGREMGGRNHTTVLHAINRVAAGVRSDPRMRTAVDNLRQQLVRTR